MVIFYGGIFSISGTLIIKTYKLKLFTFILYKNLDFLFYKDLFEWNILDGRFLLIYFYFISTYYFVYMNWFINKKKLRNLIKLI